MSTDAQLLKHLLMFGDSSDILVLVLICYSIQILKKKLINEKIC